MNENKQIALLLFIIIFVMFLFLKFGINKEKPSPDPKKPSPESITIYKQNIIKSGLTSKSDIYINIIIIKNHEYVIFDSINGIEALHSASCPCKR